ncbi:DNA gyrase inhibitor YacG [Ghiorsea bivora]|uniref:DNA gyrase inhibitor YacG n=1 Tax=Ghiorsea bivora TaxID=1485545 RepID=UPI000571447D|nr:DNA gyrase inhibitor YacG [Ghiorsea bivora]
MNKKITVKCPICKTLVEYGSENFPFCSERCQTQDLGNWASDAYAIPSDSISDEQPLDETQPQHSIH